MGEADARFGSRMGKRERLVSDSGRAMDELTMAQLEAEWQRLKAHAQ